MATSTMLADTSRSHTAPPGPTWANSVAASAEPNCTEAIATTTSPPEGARASTPPPPATVSRSGTGSDRSLTGSPDHLGPAGPGYDRGAVSDRLYFTSSDEANALIASDPLALLVGFVVEQQGTVQKAFGGPPALPPPDRACRAAAWADWVPPGWPRGLWSRCAAPGGPSPASQPRWRGACRIWPST